MLILITYDFDSLRSHGHLDSISVTNPAITVDLPEAYTSQAVIEEEIFVTITGSGEIYIGKQ